MPPPPQRRPPAPPTNTASPAIKAHRLQLTQSLAMFVAARAAASAAAGRRPGLAGLRQRRQRHCTSTIHMLLVAVLAAGRHAHATMLSHLKPSAPARVSARVPGFARRFHRPCLPGSARTRPAQALRFKVARPQAACRFWLLPRRQHRRLCRVGGGIFGVGQAGHLGHGPCFQHNRVPLGSLQWAKRRGHAAHQRAGHHRVRCNRPCDPHVRRLLPNRLLPNLCTIRVPT